MDEVIYVKALEKPNDKNGKPYLKITDQNGKIWNLFTYKITPEVGNMYLFSYTKNDRGYPEVFDMRKLENVFKQEAYKETANRNDIIRNYSIAITQAIQIIATPSDEPVFVRAEHLFEWADKIYARVNQVADEEMSKIQGIPSPKFEKEVKHE